MLFPTKNESEMLQEMLLELQTTTGITNVTAGSIARSLLEIFNKRLSSAYEYFDTYTSMSFLSTAQDMYLDMIGEMLGCTRLAQESDNNYRYRISQQVFTAAAANRTSIRLRCLAIPEVRDVIITPYSHGNGSFTIHIITDEIDTPASVLAKADTIVRENKAEGIRAIVTKPKIVPIDIRFSVTRKTGNTMSETAIASQIKESIRDYVDMISMGGTVSTDELLTRAQGNANLAQAYINSLTIDGSTIILDALYSLDWDEKAYINNVTVVI
jgi:uncharacterized phage protein gp47/JayE